jgi:hypothetical protein
MNYHQDEFTAQYNRDKVREDFNQIRVEKQLAKSRVRKPSLYIRTMHSLSSWMISTGKELHKRYELPTTHSHQSTSSSLAH